MNNDKEIGDLLDKRLLEGMSPDGNPDDVHFTMLSATDRLWQLIRRPQTSSDPKGTRHKLRLALIRLLKNQEAYDAKNTTRV